MSRVGASERITAMFSAARALRGRHPRQTSVVTIGALVVALTSCAAPVAVTPVQTAAPQCAALVGALPERLSGQERREVRPESLATAAWGDPPVVLRCSVAPPASLQPDSALTRINGIDWFAEERSRGFVFTSVGRSPAVEVTVPDAYAPEGNILAELSPVLTSQTLPDD